MYLPHFKRDKTYPLVFILLGFLLALLTSLLCLVIREAINNGNRIVPGKFEIITFVIIFIIINSCTIFKFSFIKIR